EVRRHRASTVVDAPPAALPRAGAELQHVRAGDVTEQVQVALVDALGAPHQDVDTHDRPVLPVVLVGHTVPPGTAGRCALALVDGPVPDLLGQRHVIRLLPRGAAGRGGVAGSG